MAVEYDNFTAGVTSLIEAVGNVSRIINWMAVDSDNFVPGVTSLMPRVSMMAELCCGMHDCDVRLVSQFD